MGNTRLLVVAALALLGCGVGASALAASGAVLQAHAVESQTAIFKLADGRLLRLAAGQALPDSTLRLASVDADGVTLVEAQRLAGHEVRLPLHDGDAFDPQRVEALREALQQPRRVPMPMLPVTLPRKPG